MKLNLTIVGFILLSFAETNAQNEIYLRQIGPSANNIIQVVDKVPLNGNSRSNKIITAIAKTVDQHSASGDINMNAFQNTTSGGNEVLFHQVSQASNSAILFQSGNNTSIIESEAVRDNKINIKQDGLSNYFKCTASSYASNNLEVTQSGDNNTAIVITNTMNDNSVIVIQNNNSNNLMIEQNSLGPRGNLEITQEGNRKLIVEQTIKSSNSPLANISIEQK